MRTLLGAVLVLGWLGAVASAAPRSVLVLPLDGNIDASLRGKLNAEVVRLAKTLPGTVNVADTTFEETAAAVGCDATAPACGETVRSTLGVDEIVYGRATTDGSRTDLVVYRVRNKTAPHSARASLDSSTGSDSTEPALRELFDAKSPPHQLPRAKEPVPTTTVPGEENGSTPPPPEGVSHPGRARGIIITAAGGAALAVGVGLWLSAHGDQGDIDAANPQTADDFRALHDKEDRAQRNAILGDVLVGVGAGLATWGIITIVRSQHETDRIVVAPSISSSTAGVILEGSW